MGFSLSIKTIEVFNEAPTKVQTETCKGFFKNLNDSFIETCKSSIYTLQGTSKPLWGFSTNLTRILIQTLEGSLKNPIGNKKNPEGFLTNLIVFY